MVPIPLRNFFSVEVQNFTIDFCVVQALTHSESNKLNFNKFLFVPWSENFKCVQWNIYLMQVNCLLTKENKNRLIKNFSLVYFKIQNVKTLQSDRSTYSKSKNENWKKNSLPLIRRFKQKNVIYTIFQCVHSLCSFFYKEKKNCAFIFYVYF